MRIHALQPCTAQGITNMAVINGAGGDPWKIADAVNEGKAIHANWAMDGEMRQWYTTRHDQVITRKGKPPKDMLERYKAPFAAFADQLHTAGCRGVAPFIWSNPEDCPSLQNDYQRRLVERLRNPIKRLLLPAGLRGIDPDQCEQWQPGYFDQMRKFNAVCGAGYDNTWLEASLPYMEFARFHAISGGGMSGGQDNGVTYDLNGWENMPRAGIGSPQCYLAWGAGSAEGAAMRLGIQGLDPRWLAFLITVDRVAKQPGCIPTITDPEFSQIPWQALTALLAAFRALGVQDCVYWSQLGYPGSSVSRASILAHDWSITWKHEAIEHIDLTATTLTINGFTISQAIYLSYFGA